MTEYPRSPLLVDYNVDYYFSRIFFKVALVTVLDSLSLKFAWRESWKKWFMVRGKLEMQSYDFDLLSYDIYFIGHFTLCSTSAQHAMWHISCDRPTNFYLLLSALVMVVKSIRQWIVLTNLLILEKLQATGWALWVEQGRKINNYRLTLTKFNLLQAC